jgi:hypothetical protein
MTGRTCIYTGYTSWPRRRTLYTRPIILSFEQVRVLEQHERTAGMVINKYILNRCYVLKAV